MIVERSALRAAIVHVYRLLLSQTPHCLRAAELERRWATAGIRRADLTIAMREMQHRRLVAESGIGPEAVYRLTPRGIDEYSVLRGGPFTRLSDGLTLLRMRLRSLHSRHWQDRAGHRRAGDRLIEPRLPIGW